MNPLLRKLRHPYVLKRVFLERLSEPIHLNVASLFAMLGSFRTRVAFDLVLRPQHAFGLLRAADSAKVLGISKITAIEFGVASGAGLLNLASIANAVTKSTGVAIKVVGFDTGTGMPAPIDYRDQPDLYAPGDFPMNVEKLRSRLTAGVDLIIGEVASTVPTFLETVTKGSPIGFVSIDVDYYSSTRDALSLFLAADPEIYLPVTQIYLDDVEDYRHNSWCGESLAINEFNQACGLRKIEAHTFLPEKRIFRRANWIKHMRQLHVLDHPSRQTVRHRNPIALTNPYL
jgi:hypothetical protein